MTATIVTPSIRTATRRGRFWITAVVFVIAIAVVAIVLQRLGGAEGAPLSASNAAPAGSMAVAEVLRQQGVTVTETHSLAETTAALSDGKDSTLLLFDPDAHLDAAGLQKATALSDTALIVSPLPSQLKAIAPEIAPAGAANSTTLRSGCELDAATKAGSISGGGTAYRLLDDSADAVLCFGSGKGAYSLIRLDRDGTQLTILGARSALANESVASNGNAALALGLLGQRQHLVWYLPSVEDEAGGIPTIAQLTPPWVSSLALLCFCVAIAAAFWRGRRLGPLVIENLPVTVRASETMEGRARLYQKSSARLRALDSLRIGSIERLGSLCGLPRVATVDEVIAAVATLVGADPGRIRHTVVDAVPRSDRELIQLSDELLDLERAVSRATTA